MGDSPGAVPGPILAVSGTTEDLGKLRDALRDQIAQMRAAIAEGQAGIAADQERALQAQDEAERDAAAKSIARTRTTIAEQRAAIAQLAVDVQRATQQLPKIPLKVEVQGVSQEALTILRDEFGQLLGPLNGVTGRISSLISLLKLLGSIGKESGEATASGLKTVAVSAQAAVTAAQTLGQSHVTAQEAPDILGVKKYTEESKKALDDLARYSGQIKLQPPKGWDAVGKIPGAGGPAPIETGAAAGAAGVAAGATEAEISAAEAKKVSDLTKVAEVTTAAAAADTVLAAAEKEQINLTESVTQKLEGAAAATELAEKAHLKHAESVREVGTATEQATEKTKNFATTATNVAAGATVAGEATAKAAKSIDETADAGKKGAEAIQILGVSFKEFVAIGALVASAVAVVTGALFEFGKESAEAARNYTLLGQRIGASGQEVQGLALVARAGGTSIEELVLSLSRLSFSLTGHGGGAGAGGGGGEEGSVAGAAGRAQQAIQFLIGSVNDSSGKFLPPIEIFKRLADVFQKFPDGVAKTSLAMEIFGHQGAALVPALDKGSAGINQLIEEANRLGIVIGEDQINKFEGWEKAISSAGLAWDKLKQVLGDSAVFGVVTVSVEKLTGLLDAFANATGAAAARYKNEFAKAAKDVPQTFGLGEGALTEQGKKQLDSLKEYLASQTAKGEKSRSSFLNFDSIPDQLFPPGKAAEAQALIDQLAEKVDKITDSEERRKAALEGLSPIIGRLISDGAIEIEQQDELNRLIKVGIDAQDAAEFVASGGPQRLAKFSEEFQKSLDKAGELNDKYGILGNTIGTAFEKGTVPLTTLKQKALDAYNEAYRLTKALQELQKPNAAGQSGQSQADIARAQIDASKGIDRYVAAKRTLDEASATAAQATQAEIEKAKELVNQYKNLVKEIDELNQRTVDEETKQLSAARQVQVYSDNIGGLTTKLQGSLTTFEQLTSKLPGAQSAYLDLANAQGRVVEANRAIEGAQTQGAASIGILQAKYLGLKSSLDATSISEAERNRIELEAAGVKAQLEAEEQKQATTLDDLRQQQLAATLAQNAAIASEEALTKGNAAANAQLTAYLANLKEYKTQVESLIGAKKAQKAADDATFQSGDKLVSKTGELAKQTQKLREELSEVGDKQKQLPQQVDATIKKIQEEAQVINELTAKLQQLKAQNANPALIEATQGQLNEALKTQIGNTKELSDEQSKLKESTVTVSSAWKDFSEVVQGFGVGLPKQLVRIVAMIEAVVKLTQTIEKYKQAQAALEEARKKGLDLGEKAGHIAAGGKSVGEQVSGLSPETPEVKTTTNLIVSNQNLKASVDQLNATDQQLISATQSASANQGVTNLGGEGVTPGASQLPGLGDTSGLGQGLGESGGAAAAPAAETTQIPAGIPGGGGGGGVAGLLGGGASATAGIVAGGAGLGAALGQKVGGTTGEVGGAIAGAGVGITAAAAAGVIPIALSSLAILGPIGVAIGAAVLAIGIINKQLDAAAAELAKKIEESFKSVTKAFQDGAITLGATIQAVQAQQEEAISRLTGKKGGGKQLAKLLPQFADELAQLKQQQQQVLKQFDTDLGTSRFAIGIQSTVSQIQQLNQQITDFINAGGDASQAAEFLARSLNAIQITTQGDLLNTEQGVVSLLLQQIQLRQQAAQLIHDEAQQEKDILNAGVISRTRSTAQNQALQILQLRQARDLQLKQINEQIAQNQAQVGNAQQLFGLTLNQNTLLQDQVAIQAQLTAQTNLQVAAEQKLLAALQAIPPGGTQVNLGNLLGATGAQPVPGLPSPTGGATNVPFDSSAFLAAVEGSTAGIHELQKLFGKDVPTTLTQQQEQQVIVDSQKYDKLKPLIQTWTDVMTQEIQQQQQLANALPGGASPSTPYAPLVTQLSSSQTATGSNTTAVKSLTTATQEQTAAVRTAKSGGASGGSSAATAATGPTSGLSAVPTVGTVSDALSSNQIVPVAVVGGSLDSIGEVGTGTTPVTVPVAAGSPVAPVTTIPPPSINPPAAPTGSGPSTAGGGIAATLGYSLFGHDSFGAPVYIDGATGELYNSLGEPLSPSTQVSPLLSAIPGSTGPGTTGGPPASPLPPVTGPGTGPGAPPPTGPLPGSPAEPQLPTIGTIAAGSHPAQVQIDSAIELINSIITGYNSGTITAADALAQIKQQETVLKAALVGVRQGSQSFGTADAAIQAAETALQQVASLQPPAPPVLLPGPGPNPPTGPIATEPTGPREVFSAPFLPVIQATPNLVSVGAPPATTTQPVTQPVLPRSPIITPAPITGGPTFPTSPLRGGGLGQPFDPLAGILLSTADSIHSALAAAAAKLPAVAPAGPSIGHVEINIQGTTNMSSAQLQDAVTKGLTSGFNELRGRRGVNPVGT